MIFSVLAHTPCIVFPNGTGKIEGVYSKWLQDCNYIKFCYSLNDFEDAIKSFKEIEKNVNFKFNDELFMSLYEEIKNTIH